METLVTFLTQPLDPGVAFALAGASFLGSFMTAALGFGGGAFLLAVLASLLPPAALIPVHGLVQVGSNFFRAAVLVRHVHWPPLAMFAMGTLIGVVLGGSVTLNLPPAIVQIGVGVFVIWSILLRPPKWVAHFPLLTGAISSFLTMFFGATGVFVANFTKSLNLPRHRHVATYAVMMTLQHALKSAVFGALGFAFAPWAGFILMMIAIGFAGTMTGKLFLDWLSDFNFRRGLNVVLVLLSLHLIWRGGTSSLEALLAGHFR